MKSLLLDVAQWDLVLDAAGNIAAAADPYACAQDVACAIRLFAGELFYDVSKGVPYYTEIFGHAPPLSYFEALMATAAETVPGVQSAQCTVSQLENREITGSVTFLMDNGTRGIVAI